MKRVPIIAALVISASLIIGTLWLRFSSLKRPAEVVSVNNAETSRASNEANSAMAQWFNSTSTTATSTQTDIISRKMLADYMSMAASGQVTDQTLNQLASSYAKGFSNSSIQKTLSLIDLQIVPDSPRAFIQYGAAAGNIYEKYRQLAEQGSLSSDISSDLENPKTQSAFRKLAQISQQAANELKALPVPTSLSNDHLELVNSYQRLSAALLSIANADNDASGAYSGLMTLEQLSQDESGLISSITQKLMANGASFGTNYAAQN